MTSSSLTQVIELNQLTTSLEFFQKCNFLKCQDTELSACHKLQGFLNL